MYYLKLLTIIKFNIKKLIVKIKIKIFKQNNNNKTLLLNTIIMEFGNSFLNN